MRLGEALGVASQIADALEYAHDKGIIHRDLKAANVKITPEGRLKVLDFGLAAVVHFHDASSGDPTLSSTYQNAVAEPHAVVCGRVARTGNDSTACAVAAMNPLHLLARQEYTYVRAGGVIMKANSES